MSPLLFQYFKRELEEIYRLMAEALSWQGKADLSFSYPPLDLWEKNFLPSLMLLYSRYSGYKGEKELVLAAALQMIFIASLIHFLPPDPLPEEILGGDYWYTRFLSLLCRKDLDDFLLPCSLLVCQIHMEAVGEDGLVTPLRRTKEILCVGAVSLGAQLGGKNQGKLQAWETLARFLGKLWQGERVKPEAQKALEEVDWPPARYLLGEVIEELGRGERDAGYS